MKMVLAIDENTYLCREAKKRHSDTTSVSQTQHLRKSANTKP